MLQVFKHHAAACDKCTELEIGLFLNCWFFNAWCVNCPIRYQWKRNTSCKRENYSWDLYVVACMTLLLGPDLAACFWMGCEQQQVGHLTCCLMCNTLKLPTTGSIWVMIWLHPCELGCEQQQVGHLTCCLMCDMLKLPTPPTWLEGYQLFAVLKPCDWLADYFCY